MNDFWEMLISGFDVKIMIFARIVCIFMFVPILSRTNFPTMARIGISAFITYILYFTLGITEVDTGINYGTYFFAILKEMFIGLCVGFVMNMFVYALELAGNIMDSQSGLGMAKVFDPATRIQMSVFGTIITFIFYMYFFATNSHFTLINIFVKSYEILPIGFGTLNPDLGWTIVSFFNQILIMVVKLAMPIVAVETILHFSMGVIMKMVPSIQIMVVNIQLMVCLGFVSLFIIAVPIANYIDAYLENMLESAESIIPQIFV